jgi:hypothetical protein
LVIPTQNLPLKLTISLAPFTRAGSIMLPINRTVAESENAAEMLSIDTLNPNSEIRF